MIYLEVITGIAAGITLLYLATIVLALLTMLCVRGVNILLDWTLKRVVRMRGGWA